MTQKSIPQTIPTTQKKIAIYARVSPQEQTRGSYDSCESQIEEGKAYCNAKGWSVYECIKDEGERAGTPQQPGLARIRHLIETRQIDGVVCAWSNRLAGIQDFHILNKEFQAHNVGLYTIHDAFEHKSAAERFADSMRLTIETFEIEPNEQVAKSAAERLQEAVLVTIKTFENEQIVEKAT